MTVTVTGPYTVSGYDGYTFYKFTGAGSINWTVPSDCSSVDVTVVGGGGAPDSKAGSGSGYMVSRFNQSVSGEVTIIVGGGATASLNAPVNGGRSSFGSISADGGHGNEGEGDGGNGGSGGGGLGNSRGGSNGSNGEGNYPGLGQGTGSTTNNPAPCSGTTGIDGVLRCGGGGSTSGGTGLGGAGGGGNGASPAGTSGTNDYGGGGGGRYSKTNLGGNGGSGIVIVRYIPEISKKKGQPLINPVGVLIV